MVVTFDRPHDCAAYACTTLYSASVHMKLAYLFTNLSRLFPFEPVQALAASGLGVYTSGAIWPERKSRAL
jgi:hypothetical protein